MTTYLKEHKYKKELALVLLKKYKCKKIMIEFISLLALILMGIEMIGFVLLFFNLIPAIFTLIMGGILIILMFAVVIVYNIPIRCPACSYPLEKKMKVCDQHDNYSKFLKNVIKEKRSI